MLEELLGKLEARIQKYIDFTNENSKGDFYRGNSLIGKIKFCEKKISELTLKESEEFQKNKRVENDYISWEKKKNELLGSLKDPEEGSLNFLEKELEYVKGNLKKDLNELEAKRIAISKKIMNLKESIMSRFENCTQTLRKDLRKNKENRIMVVNEFVMNPGFSKKFLSNINQARSSSYRGTYDGEENLRNLVKDYLEEYPEFSKIDIFLSNLMNSLKYFEKNGYKQITDLISVIYDRQSLYDYIFGLDYITNEFDLRLGGKKLEQLSPGERGAVLLIFYLLLDKDISPLLIDQPEDNLDNQSVANILVPYIKMAKKRRQVIMVTHNPNLAVVSDAELVIYVNIDKENNNKFSYFSGGIENALINEKIQDILEGTSKAFRIRDSKYHKYASIVE